MGLLLSWAVAASARDGAGDTELSRDYPVGAWPPDSSGGAPAGQQVRHSGSATGWSSPGHSTAVPIITADKHDHRHEQASAYHHAGPQGVLQWHGITEAGGGQPG